MAGDENNNDRNIPDDSDDCYEKLASQEEIYLEENEEEIRAILITVDPTPPCENLGEQRSQAVKDLITGDPDDPPLSDAIIEEMLNTELRPSGVAKLPMVKW